MNGGSLTGSLADTPWAAYWREGRISSCRDDEAGLYRGAIGDFWRGYFAALTDSTMILDLATGNGALPALALEVCRDTGKQLSIIGVDRAVTKPKIESCPFNNRCSVMFCRAAVEYLPLEAGVISAIVSQYGVEYSDLPAAIAETARVLMPAGWLAWLCHWRDGYIANQAQREAHDAAELLALDLSGKTKRLLKLQIVNGRITHDGHERTAASRERAELDRALRAAFSMVRDRGHPPGGNLQTYLANLGYIYQQRTAQATDAVFAALDELRHQLDYHRLRQAQLVRAALTAERLQECLQLMSGAGFERIEHGEVWEHGGSQLIAYRITARRE